MWAIIQKALLWLLDVAQIKFVISIAITSIVGLLYTLVMNLIQPYMNTSAVSVAFSSISPSVWYFADIANISSGVTIIFGAYTVRFLVRRIPFIG